MKSLFNEYLALNKDGSGIDNATWGFVQKLHEANPDVNLRDLGTVVSNAVSAYVSQEILRNAMKMRREEIRNGTKP